ncbi:MAG: hypothetical protein OJF47_001318 [Nitrospira sp.]|nr:MAG: hypothetical protein OJF47_001318 [Nitrospira sp.]
MTDLSQSPRTMMTAVGGIGRPEVGRSIGTGKQREMYGNDSRRPRRERRLPARTSPVCVL